MEDLKQQYLDELKRLSNLEYRDEIKIAELKENFNDQIEYFSETNEEFSSIDDDSFSLDNIDYVEASPPDSELSEVMEIVIPEVGGIDDDILLTIKDDILCEKLLNVNLLIAKIEALNANPTPSSDCKTRSSSTSLNSLLEETNTFDNSLPEFETFCFDVEEISSGSTTTHPDISLPEYEVFYDDHIKEISSGSPTTYYDSSLYDSFIFDLSINPFPPADRSDFYEFTDELVPFISPPDYDCFLFKVEPNSRDFTKDMVEDISLTKEPQVLNALPTHPTLQLNLKFQPSSESLFTYVVWIFLPFLVKENQKKDKIRSKPDKNGKRGEAEKIQKQLHKQVGLAGDMGSTNNVLIPLLGKMDNLDLTMEEYIEVEAKKAHFQSEFPTILYNDALTFGPEISSKPTVSPLKYDRIDFRISFDEFDDEDFIVMYNKDSFSYKLISANNFKNDLKKDIDKVNLPRSDVIVERLGDDIDANVDTES
uniref:Reverse transcriptase domain-containing protein n=1 Tax=Tanacetum cinerariifolium TaxID=118510 RepID=A0A6L2JFG1_TANCI|nr:hypothetical protein [Tanacetum cinerariifolium]